MGFSDARLAVLTGTPRERVTQAPRARRAAGVQAHRHLRRRVRLAHRLHVFDLRGAVRRRRRPTRRAPVRPQKVVILGGGPNRIGQGIEFDYCCCHACFALREAGYETIMVNCNPETVSTDYDTSDRLYFEPLTAEDVLEIIDTERPNGTLHGVIVQFGGQTPLKLAAAAGAADVPILGTSPDAIDLAEDRDRFKRCSTSSACSSRRTASPIRSSRRGSSRPISAIRSWCARPTCWAAAPWRSSATRAARAITCSAPRATRRRQGALPERQDRPDQHGARQEPAAVRPLSPDAIEVDVDCLCDGKDAFIAGIMEHIEEAGIHSGDSACSLPPHSLAATIAELERQTSALALALEVGGLMNVQYAIKDGDIYVLEVNPRASRTVPFVAKVIGLPVAKIAARIMAGETLASFGLAPTRARPYRRQGGGVPLRPLPRRRHRARPGDALDRRGDGPRPQLRRRLRQEPARRRRAAAAHGHRVRLGARRRQAAHPGAGPAAGRARLPGHRHLGHPALPGRERRRRRPDQQGAGRPPAHRRRHQERRGQLVFNTTEGARPWPTAVRCGAPPSCIKCRTTPLFPGPSPRRRASRPISGATSRCGRCRAISAGRRIRGLNRPLTVRVWDRFSGSRGRMNFGPAIGILAKRLDAGGEGTMEKIPMTAAGYAALENELKHRQQVERPRIIQQITDARTHGDLSENAEYHAAKEAQSHNEGRIAELEDKLARAEVIDVSKLSGDTIKFGATVTLVDEDTEKKQV